MSTQSFSLKGLSVRIVKPPKKFFNNSCAARANARPPIAHDMALFRGSNFFSNTKTVHRATINLTSVIQDPARWKSGSTEIIIGNANVTRTYTAVGATQEQSVTITALPTAGEYFLIDSARNEREYFVWYDDGLTAQPSGSEVSNKIPVRVKFEGTDTTTDIANKTAISLSAVGDFSATNVANSLDIVWYKNGEVSPSVRDSVTTPTGYTFNAASVVGDGEDTSAQEFLLSNQISSVYRRSCH